MSAFQTFCNAISPRRSRRDRPIADTHRPHPRREDRSVRTIIVAHQVSRSEVQGKASVICRANHSAVGCCVTSNHSNCRRPWPRTRNANKSSKVSVGTTHISIAAIASAWFRRKVFQLCDAASEIASCIWRPSTGQPRTPASRARHGSGTRPTAGFPC